MTGDEPRTFVSSDLEGLPIGKALSVIGGGGKGPHRPRGRQGLALVGRCNTSIFKMKFVMIVLFIPIVFALLLNIFSSGTRCSAVIIVIPNVTPNFPKGQSCTWS